ncbi:hypothetical protein M758_2G022400 [Ceratodon purpureus]|nr:hypothetical protein M758_2G022400 [Ceratodon purpureus]
MLPIYWDCCKSNTITQNLENLTSEQQLDVKFATITLVSTRPDSVTSHFVVASHFSSAFMTYRPRINRSKRPRYFEKSWTFYVFQIVNTDCRADFLRLLQ